MRVLAHRGWWLQAAEKNGAAAFHRAFAAGFGVETDVRDQDGVLKIAHDMPVGDGSMRFDRFLALHRGHPGAGPIALNVKADGLQAVVRAALEAAGTPPELFCFDMAVPDALGYLRAGFVTYTRHSDVEPVPPFYAQAHGVWLDAFHSDWITPEVVARHRAAGKAVALVSPELHGRDPAPAWAAWASIDDPAVMICTDLPDRAAAHWNR